MVPYDEESLMADTVKKPAAPRKPRVAKPKAEAPAETSTTVKKKPAAAPAPRSKVTPIRAASSSTVTHEQIALLAHRFWLERGGEHGHDTDDWIRAEQALLVSKAS